MSQNIDPRDQEMIDLRRTNADLTRQVAELSETLDQSSQELQSLSHSISHDLRAPLRTIMGFSKIVLAGSTENLPPESIDGLQRISAGAERMGALIDDLLKLSRISRMELRRETLDISQLAGKVVAIYKGGSAVPAIEAGDSAVIVLDKTPFYAESGGQVGDRGQLVASRGTFHVSDTQKIQSEVFGHHGVLHTGVIAIGDTVEAKVDTAARSRAAYNHSATHLMHAALRKVLGPHVQQKGSLVDADRTRFDYSHNEPLNAQQIREIEQLVNQEIRRNEAVEARIMKYDDAIKTGAMALFGEKYGDEVRVLTMGDFSTELCGGTHVGRTGDIGFFKVVSESGIAAGVRRIEAVTAEGALSWVQQQEASLQQAAGALKAPVQEVTQKIGQIVDNVKSLEKELARLKSKLASSQGDDVAAQAVGVKGAKVLAALLDGADSKALREAMDKLKDKLKSCAVVLAAVEGGKVTLIAGVSADLIGKVKAGELVNFVAQQVGGKGGGRPDMAQAGGTDPSKLPQALASVQAWVEQKL